MGVRFQNVSVLISPQQCCYLATEDHGKLKACISPISFPLCCTFLGHSSQHFCYCVYTLVLVWFLILNLSKFSLYLYSCTSTSPSLNDFSDYRMWWDAVSAELTTMHWSQQYLTWLLPCKHTEGWSHIVIQCVTDTADISNHFLHFVFLLYFFYFYCAFLMTVPHNHVLSLHQWPITVVEPWLRLGHIVCLLKFCNHSPTISLNETNLLLPYR